MQYAVIKTGGKQYRVSKGDEINIEKIPAEENKTLTFEEVLLVGDDKDVNLGQPLIKNAKVKAKILSQFRGEKIRVARFRKRKRHYKVQGHRKDLTRVQILDIEIGKSKTLDAKS